MATVDYLRAQVSCALSLANLLILLLNMALSTDRCGLDFTQKNLAAMQRQVKGLQAEYERVTAAAAAGGKGEGAAGGGGARASGAGEEAAALKRTVDKLIAEKQQLQGDVEASEKAAKAAEARVAAMVQQIKGFDREFDRLLDENRALTAQVAALRGGGGAAAGAGPGPAAGGAAHKKDD